ncbi:hypothetical protein ACEQ8H_000374 [Pleosporales sp. CAS-2024a]
MPAATPTPSSEQELPKHSAMVSATTPAMTAPQESRTEAFPLFNEDTPMDTGTHSFSGSQVDAGAAPFAAYVYYGMPYPGPGPPTTARIHHGCQLRSPKKNYGAACIAMLREVARKEAAAARSKRELSAGEKQFSDIGVKQRFSRKLVGRAGWTVNTGTINYPTRRFTTRW